MRKIILAALVAATAIPLASMPASAQPRGSYERQERRECNRELRNADDSREYWRERRECEREIARAERQDWRQGRRYAPASAQQRGSNERQERRECNRELRNADNPREYWRERRECEREIAQAQRQDWRQGRRYDYNRPPAGGTYFADDYYRDGRYYRERRLSYNDRVYQGRDGRYYCRRNDGTTGLIIGAGAGALVGNALDGGRSSTLGTILGAVAGGALGREIERDGRRDLRCR